MNCSILPLINTRSGSINSSILPLINTRNGSINYSILFLINTRSGSINACMLDNCAIILRKYVSRPTVWGKLVPFRSDRVI
jgi:hypothetical protein